MTAIGKVRSFAESREPDVAVIRDGITYGDARELLQEIDRMRDELITVISLLARAYRGAGNDVAANSVDARLRALRGDK